MEDSEWDYEYDETQTEDIYVTLDLTTHVPPSLPSQRKGNATKKPTKSPTKNQNAQGSELQDSPSNLSSGATPTPTPAPNSRMQIVDLHGPNPLISYDNTLYTCHWATDVGTSIFLTEPSDHADPAHLPLRSTPSFDLLGTTSARLMAVPTTIRPRQQVAPVEVGGGARPTPETITITDSGDEIERGDGTGLKINLPANAPPNRVSQARFLERLSAIKRRKGEGDAVPVQMIKGYNRPADWESVREAWLAREAAAKEQERGNAAGAKNGQGQTDGAADGEEEDDGEEMEDAGEVTEDEDPEDYVGPGQKRRGGNRGGRLSNKKLRENMGLPEARYQDPPRKRQRASRDASLAPETPAGEGTEAGATGPVGQEEGQGQDADPHAPGEEGITE